MKFPSSVGRLLLLTVPLSTFRLNRNSSSTRYTLSPSSAQESIVQSHKHTVTGWLGSAVVTKDLSPTPNT